MRVVSADWVVPVEGEPIADGAVAIAEDGRIAAVGSVSELGDGERFRGCVIAPGFVNCHSHLEYAVYAGFGDGLPFVPWIGLHIRRKERLELDDMRAIATVGAWDCLRSGITTIGDCSFAGAAAEAAAATGLSALVFLEVFGTDDAALDRFHENRARIEPVLSDRVRLGVSPHAPYTCSLDVFRACAALGLPLQTHIAESPAERPWLVEGTGDWTPLADFLVPPAGETGVRILARAGLLGPTVSAAHCVHVDDEEIALLAAHGVGVAHCPRSNGVLGCGTAPLRELLEAGIPVGIATDSPASTPSFDLFEELRTAIVAARAREERPEALTAAQALELATLGGARVLGLEGEVGSLVPGKWADLQVVSLDGSPFEPVEDPVVATVLGGSPDRVAATLVAGEDRYRRGTSAWPDSRRAARRARSRMLR
ncbi:MAG TPA: amidohydrolase family protein [Gaiella sp.]|jgi:5-methylthioadenosine/S-adenosylhomocysteine deaminase|nr:amidohydrolase family protein [Gaiella sp.]